MILLLNDNQLTPIAETLPAKGKLDQKLLKGCYSGEWLAMVADGIVGVALDIYNDPENALEFLTGVRNAEFKNDLWKVYLTATRAVTIEGGPFLPFYDVTKLLGKHALYISGFPCTEVEKRVSFKSENLT